MYENFYNFNEKPFQIVPNPAYLYRSEKHKLLSTLWSHHLVERPENQLTGVGFLCATDRQYG